MCDYFCNLWTGKNVTNVIPYHDHVVVLPWLLANVIPCHVVVEYY